MSPISRRIVVVGSLASGFALAVRPVAAVSQDRSMQMEIAIRAKDAVTTLINIFVVEPQDQERLLQLLAEGTETLFSKQPGYIAASFHKSKDGRRIVNYGQWRSPQDIEAFRSKPELGAYFARVKALAQFEAIICEASYVHHV
jgi:quinol monooxygenase YgiN